MSNAKFQSLSVAIWQSMAMPLQIQIQIQGRLPKPHFSELELPLNSSILWPEYAKLVVCIFIFLFKYNNLKLRDFWVLIVGVFDQTNPF